MYQGQTTNAVNPISSFILSRSLADIVSFSILEQINILPAVIDTKPTKGWAKMCAVLV